MAFLAPEVLAAGAEALTGGGEAAATAGAASEAPSIAEQAGGQARDFNDAPVGKTQGTLSKIAGWGAKSYIGHEIAAPFEGHGGGGGGGGGEAGPSTGGTTLPGDMGNVG